MTSPDTGLIRSYRATPLGLNDMASPTAPSHINARNAIEEHRNGGRAPVAFHPETEGIHAE